jgi:hypothetical protein
MMGIGSDARRMSVKILSAVKGEQEPPLHFRRDNIPVLARPKRMNRSKL